MSEARFARLTSPQSLEAREEPSRSQRQLFRQHDRAQDRVTCAGQNGSRSATSSSRYRPCARQALAISCSPCTNACRCQLEQAQRRPFFACRRFHSFLSVTISMMRLSILSPPSRFVGLTGRTDEGHTSIRDRAQREIRDGCPATRRPRCGTATRRAALRSTEEVLPAYRAWERGRARTPSSENTRTTPVERLEPRQRREATDASGR